VSANTEAKKQDLTGEFDLEFRFSFLEFALEPDVAIDRSEGTPTRDGKWHFWWVKKTPVRKVEARRRT
jgi:hypothetical protein